MWFDPLNKPSRGNLTRISKWLSKTQIHFTYEKLLVDRLSSQGSVWLSLLQPLSLPKV